MVCRPAGDETLYTFSLPGPWVDNLPKGLWSWMGHWIPEVKEQAIVDGESFNEAPGYDEIFAYRVLKGQSFYFFNRGGRVGISYGGQVLPYECNEVIHYRCSSMR